MPVELQNESRLQDMEKLVSIDQISAKVYLWAPGLTWEDIETNGVLFSGAFVKRYHTLDRYVFDIEDIQYTKFKTIPRAVIDSTAWPNHRSSTPGTPCSGKWVPLVFGDWTVSRGAKLPMWCIDTVNGIYVACFGTPKSVDADFDADTDCRIWEADGDKIAAANYAWALRTDGRGHQMTGPDFSVEENTNETLTCAMEGYIDSSGLITGTAGTLLEHPAHIAYYLMRYESLLANAELC